METELELWPNSSTEDSDTEEGLFEFQECCAADLSRHPQLDTDIEAVRTLYSDSAVSTRAHEFIDSVDVDLNIMTSFLDKEVTKAWKINPSEPIVIRLYFSLSQYLDGPVPSVKVFQLSNKDNFCLGRQLQNILRAFLSQEWKHLTNENVVCRKRRQSWLRPSGTIKKVRSKLNIWFPLSKSDGPKEPSKNILTAMKFNHFPHRTNLYTIKNSRGQLISYTRNGKRVVGSEVKSSAHVSTKQPTEPLSSSQAKTTLTPHHGILVEVMKYAMQRMLTLNEHCVICDERHVFQNGPMLKPAVCTRELCVFSFHTLGVMSGVTQEVASGAEVVDLLVVMCREALQSSRKSIIFEPYPSVVDPCDHNVLAFSPQKKNDKRLQQALDSILLTLRMAQGPYSEIKKQMDKIDPLAHPLLQWILESNRSHIVKLPLNKQVKFMHTPHQFLLVSSPPSKEASFQNAKKLHGSTFAFHGSHIENWHSILRNGLINASHTKFQVNGAAYGKGIYLSPISNISFGYSEMGKGRYQITPKEHLLEKQKSDKTQQEHPENSRFLESGILNCIALCEVITSEVLQKHGNIWVCPESDHVCTRFLFVYENGQVGDTNINTQGHGIKPEILHIIASMSS
ncbi:protein mono-ADP-ribosyltransferase PARP6-like isoform X2 [Antennarius striatus]|uniref:protein mono-ADP-ribosyltransferase PARP6-like isoform X2 n=1 Tax=Antennarius striatus TaxID=241820 RepID=UPI0035B33D5D